LPFLPLATSIAASFYQKQTPGRFDFWELLNVAVEALAGFKGANHARKAVWGALRDFARNDKVVKNVEMRPDRYAPPWGNLAPPPAVIGPPDVFYQRGVYYEKGRPPCFPVHPEEGVRVTIYPTEMLTGLSRSVLYLAIKSGELPSRVIGSRRRRIILGDLEKFCGAPIKVGQRASA
jgi:hypothetical protein